METRLLGFQSRILFYKGVKSRMAELYILCFHFKRKHPLCMRINPRCANVHKCLGRTRDSKSSIDIDLTLTVKMLVRRVKVEIVIFTL